MPIVSRSPVPFYGPSIAFTDHSYRLQVTCTFLRTIHSFYNHSYRLQVTCTFLRTIHSFYRSFLSSPGHLYLFTDYPLLLQIIPIVSRSSVPFYGPSIAFTDHSYRLQVTCTFSQTIHTFTDHSYRLQVTCTFLRTIHSFYRSFLSSPGHLYLFTDYSLLLQILSIISRSPVPFYGPSIALQIIPIVSRSPVPFYEPSIASTDHSYRFQVTRTFLRTIHSFYRSFLSSPGHLYLFTNHP